VRCARCGNDNPEGNRFCGMCGASLLAGTAATATQSAAVSATAAGSQPATQPERPAARAAAASDDSPIISGPSFLGLDQPGPAPRRANLRIEPHGAPSSSDLDYLLEDEGHHKGGGAGKFVLIVLALALAAGLGYLRWKHQGLPWLGSSGSGKPAASAPSTDAQDSPPASSTAPAPTGVNAQTAPATQTPATTEPQPVTDAAAPGTGTPAVTPSPAPDPGDAAASSGAAHPATSATPPAQPPPAKEKIVDPNVTTYVPPVRAGRGRSVKPVPTPKPHAAILPAQASDPVSEAQKYIYGRGARQDCERGLRILKPAADQGTPKAMVEMGALYSAGLCTPRDLPTAYRWFALALRKEPENQPLQADLQKLWSEMTQPERQLAIKLSQ
jgi:hypothetical protein